MWEAFADSGYWIALHNPDDEWHRKAQQLTNLLQNCTVVTSEMVLVEFLNFCSRQGAISRRQAADTVLGLYADPNVLVISHRDIDLPAAIELYAGRPDQRWSLTDCASFLIMEERGITDALAYDRDFEQAGFRALLREG